MRVWNRKDPSFGTLEGKDLLKRFVPRINSIFPSQQIDIMMIRAAILLCSFLSVFGFAPASRTASRRYKKWRFFDLFHPLSGCTTMAIMQSSNLASLLLPPPIVPCQWESRISSVPPRVKRLVDPSIPLVHPLARTMRHSPGALRLWHCSCVYSF